MKDSYRFDPSVLPDDCALETFECMPMHGKIPKTFICQERANIAADGNDL